MLTCGVPEKGTKITEKYCKYCDSLGAWHSLLFSRCFVIIIYIYIHIYIYIYWGGGTIYIYIYVHMAHISRAAKLLKSSGARRSVQILSSASWHKQHVTLTVGDTAASTMLPCHFAVSKTGAGRRAGTINISGRQKQATPPPLLAACCALTVNICHGSGQCTLTSFCRTVSEDTV